MSSAGSSFEKLGTVVSTASPSKGAILLHDDRIGSSDRLILLDHNKATLPVSVRSVVVIGCHAGSCDADGCDASGSPAEQLSPVVVSDDLGLAIALVDAGSGKVLGTKATRLLVPVADQVLADLVTALAGGLLDPLHLCRQPLCVALLAEAEPNSTL